MTKIILYFVQYRKKLTEHYASDLHKINVPCRVVMTLRQVKTVLPLQKLPVERIFNDMYKIVCKAWCVGKTSQQMTFHRAYWQKSSNQASYDKMQLSFERMSSRNVRITHKRRSPLIYSRSAFRL